MYRLLIVDDEPLIADGLFNVLSKFDIELALSIAYSGVEALEIMNKGRVDIILTDIKMPGMDGIQLMQQIKANWSHCKIIFLTGHNEFEYVYKAIQQPNVSYILKTEGYIKIKDTIREAVKQLDDELHMKDLLVHAQENSNTLETMFQGEYIRHFIKGNRGLNKMEEDFKKLNISIDGFKPIFVVLGVLNIPVDNPSYMSRQEAALAVKFLADTFLKEKVNLLSVLDRYQDVMWLIQPHSEDEQWDCTVQQIEGIFELIERACTSSLNIHLSFTIVNHSISLKSLPFVYEKLRQLQGVRVGDGTHMVQTVDISEGLDTYVSHPLINQRSYVKHIDLLAIHLESGREAEFVDIFNSIVKEIDDYTDPSIAMECYYSLAVVLLSHINRFQLYDELNIKRLMSFDDHPSWSEGFNYLLETVRSLFSYREKGERNRAADAISNLCTFIEQHLNENLSLVRLAELIHFNPSYLSRMFKQECGCNLSDYIEERRINKAKELLRNQELKIAEVGAKVGYEAPHSFTRFFKKMTAITPQEYRDGRD